VYVGARLSSRAGLPFIRPALAIVLMLSGAKLLQASNVELALLLAAAMLFVAGYVAGSRTFGWRKLAAAEPVEPDPATSVA
jgi:membrane-bound ClpP family serine protease